MHGPVKDHVNQNRDEDAEAIRCRLLKRMADKGIAPNNYAAIAEITGDERKNVNRWISGGTAKLPAAFVARLERRGFVSAKWLLAEEGSPEPMRPGEAEIRLAATQQILDLGLRLATTAEIEDLEGILEIVRGWKLPDRAGR